MLPPAAWKLCQSFLVHGLTVAAVLNSHEWMHLPRDLDCVEIFAGVGSIAAAAAEKGLRAAAYDKWRIPGATEEAEDILTLQGFRGAIALVMRLVSHGLLWLAPDCSSWGFLNCARCQRSEANGYMGDVTYPKVVAGNSMAESSVFLILLAAARGVKAALENPVGSHFFQYGPVMDMAHSLNMVSAYTHRCAFSVAPFGKRYKKKYKFLATSSWIRGVFAACRCPGNVHLKLSSNKVGKEGRMQTNGIKARLKESGAYPIALGQRVVECACPGQAGMGVAVGTLQESAAQRKAKKPARTPSATQRSARKMLKCHTDAKVLKYLKTRTSAVSSVARDESMTAARSWTTPSVSSSTRIAPPPLTKARAWCTPSASSASAQACSTPSTSSVSSPSANAHACPVSSGNGGKKRSWCTPAATSSSKPSSARAVRAWLEP